MLRNKCLDAANGVAARMGLRLSRIRLDQVSVDEALTGRSLLYKTSFDPVFSNLPLQRAHVSFTPLSCKKAPHQNVVALEHALNFEHSRRTVAISTFLECYSTIAQEEFKTLADTLGMHSSENPSIDALPPWCRLYPWSDSPDPAKAMERINFSTYVENRKRGGPPLNAEQGGAQFPLISPQRAHFEARLLSKTLVSLERHGFSESLNLPDPIGCVLLIKNKDEWCWNVSGGIHRICALQALGYSSVPIWIKRVIYRDDVADWPNVRHGLFDERTAVSIFDRIVSGQPAKAHLGCILKARRPEASNAVVGKTDSRQNLRS